MELKSVQTAIKILFDENNEKEDMDQLQRDASTSTSRNSTKADLNYSNGKMSANEGLIVRVNRRWKNCANNDAVEPQQIPTIVNWLVVHRKKTGVSIKLKSLEGINTELKTRNKKE
jgi:hypothetical protein